VLELLNVRWSDEYDNDIARRPARTAVIRSEEVSEPWLNTQIDRFEDYRGSWRDYRNFELSRRFEERVDIESFRKRFDELYEETVEEDSDGNG
jgi:hypothetical protein